jgi:uncharacterized protein
MIDFKKISVFVAVLVLPTSQLFAQNKGLTNTSASKFSQLNSVGLGEVQFTKGFMANRFEVCRNTMVPTLWDRYTDTTSCYAFRNFEIAAGLQAGTFKGPSFNDGDFYKTLEAMASMYAQTKDPKIDALMDKAIAVIGKAQKADGYIYTKSIIEQKASNKPKMFDDKLSFEAYNFGHLMTAACVHYRATGKTNLLEIAKKATDFLIVFYNTASPEQARNAICPSHYMGIVEMYRTTHETKYLDLVKKLIDIRGQVEGTDDNSDRAPFRKMTKVIGHAVRANYLFAGVADLYAETGDETLLRTLDLMWDDVVNHKMYITGGCGALYDGVSPDGTSYKPDTVQKVHQSYGKAFQLPNHAAHNETCANIGNLLWNWRMLQITGDAKYADIVELEIYNSILSGINLDGNKFFYTNPLSASDDFPYKLRWYGGRQSFISLSNCCPPNVVRTISEMSNYFYSHVKNGLYVNLYGGNKLNTTTENGALLAIEQITNYPWNGSVDIKINAIQAAEFSFFLRIPAWANGAQIMLNGKKMNINATAGTYAEVKRLWKKGDVLSVQLPMEVQLMESNPLVEETRNQVAVKRGPIVYCLESNDLESGNKVANVLIPADTKWSPKIRQIANTAVMTLDANVRYEAKKEWKNALYQPLRTEKAATANITLIPYFAWANRGHSEMSVWLPVSK